MKPYFYLIIFLLISSSVKAQPYQSLFGKTSTAWVFLWGNIAGDNIDSAYVQKDTLVNGIAYKKILKLYGSFKGGLIREDSSIGKVWYRDLQVVSSPNDTVEKLAFDYSLKAGDTFNICNSNFPFSCADSFKIVDSVRMKNGLKNIYFKAKYSWGEPYTLIEGNTSNMGVFLKHSGITYMSGQYLLCVYKDGIKTSFENLLYEGACDVPLSVKHEPIIPVSVTIYPNPTEGVLSIQNTTHEKISQIEIFDGMGKLVQNIEQQNIPTINLRSLPSGLYIARMSTEAQHIIQKTFIIQR